MEETGSSLARRGLAALILVIAAWILIKIVIGIVAGLFWVVVAALAIFAVIWAWRVLF
jgi:predicted membrane protein